MFPATVVVLKLSSALTSAGYNQVRFRQDFIMDANTDTSDLRQ